MNSNSFFWGNHEFLEDERFAIPHIGILPSHPKWDDLSWVQPGDSTFVFLKTKGEWFSRLKYKRWVMEQILLDSNRYRSKSPTCLITHGGIAAGKTSVVDEFLKDASDLGPFLRIDLDARGDSTVGSAAAWHCVFVRPRPAAMRPTGGGAWQRGVLPRPHFVR